MAFDTPINTFSLKYVDPALAEDLAVAIDVNLQPSLTIGRGTLLGQVAASVNDVQTLTVTGTPTSGSQIVAVTSPISGSVVNITIPYNATSTVLQGLLDGAFGTGNFTAGGGAWPGSALTITGANNFAALPVAPITLVSSTLNAGATVAVTHTTQGATAGTYGPYSSAVVSPPAAPTVTGTGSGSAFAAGTYLVQVTAVNALGETTPSPESPVTLTIGQKINVASVSGLNATVTGLNVYVDGALLGQAAVSGGVSTATQFDAAGVSAKGDVPQVNTAFTAASGLQVPSAIAQYDYTTDSAGNISMGLQNTGGDLGQTQRAVPVWVKGIFNSSDLVGLDAYAVTTNKMRIFQGSITAGLIELV